VSLEKGIRAYIPEIKRLYRTENIWSILKIKHQNY
jgi:hypothetical protein